MTRRTSGGHGSLAAATALTTWLALASWGGFVEHNATYLGPLILGMAVLAGVGVAARSVRLPATIVLSCQLLSVFLVLNVGWGSGWLPTPDSLREFVRAFDAAVDAAQSWAAPVPDEAPSISVILVGGGLLCHLLVDFCAVTLGRVPLAGLPVLTIYSLPVSVLDRSVSWVVFVVTAGGFLMMLALQESDRVTRWGRPLGASEESDPKAFGVGAARSNTMAVGASAITMALVLPLLIPTLDLDVLGGTGSGPGRGGDRTVRIENPIADLKRDLERGDDVPLVRVTTTDLDPSYLRIAVLTTFTGNTWTTGGRDLPASQLAAGDMPAPTGLSPEVKRAEVPWDLSVTDDLDSLWLPAPRYVKSINAGTRWRYDSETQDFHAGDNHDSTRGIDYSLVALDVDLTGDGLVEAGEPPFEISSVYTKLPGDVPEIVGQLAQEVTAGQPNDYQRAVALQQWFWDNFEYSLATEPGNGSDALERFLSPGGRIGYCEQFGSAMAVMARSLGIPARVAVGLLDAERVGGGPENWEFTAHDMHLWPELYFEGFGWVLFEPTPPEQTGRVPAYTRGNVSSGPTEAPSTNTQSAQPSESASPRRPESTTPDGQSSGDDENSGFPFGTVLGGLGALLLLVGLALVPSRLRRRRSVRRWDNAADPAEAAWWELRDTALDLGIRWPAGRSPRAGAAAIAEGFAAPPSPDTPERPARGPRTNPEAVTALGQIVHALELSRYAPAGQSAADVDEMRACAETCAVALRAGAGRRARRAATWWPRSVLLGAARRRQGTSAMPVRTGPGVVDNLG
jgi:transglutaminase-like putative cysteine protease